MSRRRSARRPRRLQVQFWKRGEPQPYPGYTTNLSVTGMFLATNSAQPPGTRLRIEILEGDRGFMVEGVVAHARKIHGDMMRLNQPGMGIRFLTIEELVRELIPVAAGEMEEVPRPSSPPPPVHGAPGAGPFSVHFVSPEEFLEIYRRDIANGGLFVSTRYPGRLHETVGIDLHPPVAGVPPIALRARVVQRFEPQEEDSGAGLAGMGVEILDLPAVLEKLRPVVQGLG